VICWVHLEGRHGAQFSPRSGARAVPGTTVLSFHAMHPLRCRLSDSLWHALRPVIARTGESIEHIVHAALADRLQVEHSTLFQISSSGALVEGIYKGEVTVGALREHGDFGLGTFAELDGS